MESLLAVQDILERVPFRIICPKKSLGSQKKDISSCDKHES